MGFAMNTCEEMRQIIGEFKGKCLPCDRKMLACQNTLQFILSSSYVRDISHLNFSSIETAIDINILNNIPIIQK